MDYKVKIKEILKDKTIPEEQRKKLEEILLAAEEIEEDKRLKEFLCKTFTKQYLCSDKLGKWHGEPVANILAWLEKQGEQKPYGQRKKCSDCQFNYAGECKGSCQMKRDEQKTADKVEPEFHEGDWVILTVGELSITLQIVKVDTNKKLYWFNDSSYLPIVDEECLHLWTIQDAKDGDVLYSPNLKLLWIFKSRDTVYCGCNLNYNDGAICGEGYFQMPTDAMPTTKEQRELLFQKMKEAGYEWNSEEKELKKKSSEEKGNNGETSPNSWSEEDENKLIDSLMQYLWDLYHKDCDPPKPDIKTCDDWIYCVQKLRKRKLYPEDKFIIQDIINICEQARKEATNEIDYENVTRCIDWLKSLEKR